MKLTCKKHPKYAAKRQPRITGNKVCGTCWLIWQWKQGKPKKEK